jgi:hypothetical protein
MQSHTIAECGGLGANRSRNTALKLCLICCKLRNLLDGMVVVVVVVVVVPS